MKKLRIAYAVRVMTFDGAAVWLRDTCAHGSWCESSQHAMTWASREDLLAELAAAEIIDETHPPDYPLEIVELVEVR